ncbi:bifunctional precorrin-2 dehydrogenase/sirohydrochlorin ferrochelatase [Roseivirga sp. BDSF3-8]|uniref:precorrin-2 dehydrogenase/sirohydrochlorin ferrochelatase family protein n=1 Tax=Roseivirga sp. BDSF3-8 TaxID=3241598 RepID=UPI003531D2E9
MHNPGNTLFPIFCKIDRLRVLVVGGGPVGLEKVQALLKNNPEARITLVAIDICDELYELGKGHPTIELHKRAFVPEDLEGADLLILATGSRETSEEIREMAWERHLLTNVADTPDLCDFYLGSTVKKGDLKIGISTNGKSPTFAKRFRELLEESLPEDIDALLQNLHEVRNMMTGDFQEKVEKLNALTADLTANRSQPKAYER